MIAKRAVARTTAVTAVLAFVTLASVGIHHDAGNWSAVALFWIAMVGIGATVSAVSWAIDNWNAR